MMNLLKQHTSLKKNQLPKDSSSSMDVCSSTEETSLANRTQIAFQLNKICKQLTLKLDDYQDVEEIMNQIITTLQTYQQEQGSDFIIEHILSDNIHVNEQQYQQLLQIENAFYQVKTIIIL